MSMYSHDFSADTSWPVEATRRMNRLYRRQRLSVMAWTTGSDLRFERLFRGYARYAVLTFPKAPKVA